MWIEPLKNWYIGLWLISPLQMTLFCRLKWALFWLLCLPKNLMQVRNSLCALLYLAVPQVFSSPSSCSSCDFSYNSRPPAHLTYFTSLGCQCVWPQLPSSHSGAPLPPLCQPGVSKEPCSRWASAKGREQRYSPLGLHSRPAVSVHCCQSQSLLYCWAYCYQSDSGSSAGRCGYHCPHRDSCPCTLTETGIHAYQVHHFILWSLLLFTYSCSGPSNAEILCAITCHLINCSCCRPLFLAVLFPPSWTTCYSCAPLLVA